MKPVQIAQSSYFVHSRGCVTYKSGHFKLHFVCCFRMCSSLALVATKPVFGVSNKASFKPVSSATETSWKIEISLVASLDMIILDK